MPGPSSTPATQHTQFVNGLAAATGLDPKVVDAWTRVEGAYAKDGTGGHNYLNIRANGSSGYSGVPIPTVSTNGFAQFASVSDAIKESAYWINTMPNYATIRSSTHLGPKSQLAAIAASPWDKGHYNGGRSLYDAYQSIIHAPGIDWGKIGSAVGDAATGNPFAIPGDLGAGGWFPGAKGIVSAVDAPVKIAQDFGSVVGIIAKTENWLRAGYILGGGLMVLLGAVLLAKSVGALNVVGPATPELNLASRASRQAAASPYKTSREGTGPAKTKSFDLGLPNQGRRPKRGQPGSTKLAHGDSIPFD